MVPTYTLQRPGGMFIAVMPCWPRSSGTASSSTVPSKASVKVVIGMRNNLYLLLRTVDHVVIRTAGCRILMWALFACLFAPVTSSAHLLNMTELHLDSTHPTSTKLKIKIDLGQSLMTAEEYWNASTSDIQEQSIIIKDIADEIKSGVRLTVDDRSVDFELHSWSLEASSLEAIKNPFSPQMAQLVFNLNSTMPSEGSVEIQIGEQLEVPWPALLRMDHASSPLPVSRLLTESERSSRPITFGSYLETPEEELSAKAVLAIQTLVPGLKWIALGFQHIIPKGLDHIVFVLGLFFLSTGVKTLILQVSCFTLAHSLTLGMATFGLVSAPGSIVEPLIAASIICIALDNLYSESLARWRLMMVTLFGLLHGLGFASVLSGLDLSRENFLSSLLLFNIGVEIGQLTVLMMAFVAVGWMRSWSQYTERVARPATISIAGIGTYWLINRIAFI